VVTIQKRGTYTDVGRQCKKTTPMTNLWGININFVQ